MPALPSSPKPAGDDRNLVAIDATTAVSLEEKLHIFWKNNGNAVLILCGLVILGIIAKFGWDYVSDQKELDIEKDYAAATTPEQKKAFAASHADHSLGGVAALQAADAAVTAGKPADAIASYEQAGAALKDGPLAARAKFGAALAKVLAGKTAEGMTALKQFADDSTQPKGLRTEALYHLTSIAVDNGSAADAQKYSGQAAAIDSSSPWTQRALAMRATLPAIETPKAETAAPAATPTVKLPGK
jgi:hypothetical protein